MTLLSLLEGGSSSGADLSFSASASVSFAATAEHFASVSFGAEASLSPAAAVVAFASVDYDATADLDAAGSTVIDGPTIRFSARASFVPTLRPRGKKRRTVVVDVFGEPFGELENAQHGAITWELNRWEEATFALGTADAKGALVLEERIREVQLWRGDQLLVFGPMVRPAADKTNVGVSVKGPLWHLSRRHVGKANRLNRLANPSFEDGLGGWGFLKTITSERDYQPLVESQVRSVSIGLARPKHETRMLSILSDHDPETFDGAIFGFQEFDVDGGDRGIVATLSGWVYVPLSAYAGPPPEGHSLVLARFESDFLTNNYWTENALPNTWGGRRAYYTERIESSYALIDEDFPLSRWVRQETSLTIPPGWAGVLQAKLWGAQGRTYYDGLSLTFDDALEFSETDQSEIVEGLVEHAQDPAYDKSDVNLTVSAPATDVLRDLVALHSEHANIWELLSGYTELADGFDLSAAVSPTDRVVTVHYPRKGFYRPDLSLELGRNVADFAWTFDGESASSVVIVLGTGDGSDREEASAIDLTAFAGGLTLEDVFSAPEGTTVELLPQVADERLATVRAPEVLAVKTHPNAAVELVGVLAVGDTLPVRIRRAALSIVGIYRVVRLTLNTNDTLDLILNRRDDET